MAKLVLRFHFDFMTQKIKFNFDVTKKKVANTKTTDPMVMEECRLVKFICKIQIK